MGNMGDVKPLAEIRLAPFQGEPCVGTRLDELRTIVVKHQTTSSSGPPGTMSR